MGCAPGRTNRRGQRDRGEKTRDPGERYAIDVPDAKELGTQELRSPDATPRVTTP